MANLICISAILLVFWATKSEATVEFNQIFGVPTDPADFDPINPRHQGSELRMGYERSSLSSTELAQLSRLNVERNHNCMPFTSLNRLNESVNFYGFLYNCSTIARANASNGRSMSFESDIFELGAGPAMRLGQLSFGGAVSYLSMGSELRRAVTGGGTYSSQAGSAAMPRIELWAAASGQASQVRVGFKTYAGQEVDSKLEYNATNYVLRSKRAVPGEFVISGSLDVDEDLRIHVGIGARQYQQSSLAVDEFFPTTGVIAAGGATARTQGPQRETSAGYFYLSGLYRATPGLGLTSSVHYRQPSYRQDSDASSFFANLGHKSIAVGIAQTGVGMQLGFDVEYRSLDTTSFSGNALSQRWAEAGEQIKIQGSEWLAGMQLSLVY